MEESKHQLKVCKQRERNRRDIEETSRKETREDQFQLEDINNDLMEENKTLQETVAELRGQLDNRTMTANENEHLLNRELMTLRNELEEIKVILQVSWCTFYNRGLILICFRIERR